MDKNGVIKLWCKDVFSTETGGSVLVTGRLIDHCWPLPWCNLCLRPSACCNNLLQNVKGGHYETWLFLPLLFCSVAVAAFMCRRHDGSSFWFPWLQSSPVVMTTVLLFPLATFLCGCRGYCILFGVCSIKPLQ